MKTLGILLLISVFAGLLTGCVEQSGTNGISISASTLVSVLDDKGNNLLDPEFEGAFKSEEIKIFYIRNGKIEEFFNPDLDMPRNFRVYKHEVTDEYMLVLGLEYETIVQWREGVTDTLRTEFYYFRENSGFRVDKIHYKGKVVYDYDATGGENPNFTIRK